jgi:hypothetical protein
LGVEQATDGGLVHQFLNKCHWITPASGVRKTMSSA